MSNRGIDAMLAACETLPASRLAERKAAFVRDCRLRQTLKSPLDQYEVDAFIEIAENCFDRLVAKGYA